MYIHSFNHIHKYIYPSPFAEVSFHLFIALKLSGENLPVVPSRESNSGLPYSKPTLYENDFAYLNEGIIWWLCYKSRIRRSINKVFFVSAALQSRKCLIENLTGTFKRAGFVTWHSRSSFRFVHTQRYIWNIIPVWRADLKTYFLRRRRKEEKRRRDGTRGRASSWIFSISSRSRPHTVKKRFASFPSPARMSLPNSPSRE